MVAPVHEEPGGTNWFEDRPPASCPAVLRSRAAVTTSLGSSLQREEDKGRVGRLTRSFLDGVRSPLRESRNRGESEVQCRIERCDTRREGTESLRRDVPAVVGWTELGSPDAIVPRYPASARGELPSTGPAMIGTLASELLRQRFVECGFVGVSPRPLTLVVGESGRPRPTLVWRPLVWRRRSRPDREALPRSMTCKQWSRLWKVL